MSKNSAKRNQPILTQTELRWLSQCQFCKKSYKTDESNILEQKQSSFLLHITCPYCKNAILVAATSSPIGVGSIGMLTDLSKDDIRRLHLLVPVTEDELLDLHALLGSNNNIKLLTN